MNRLLASAGVLLASVVWVTAGCGSSSPREGFVDPNGSTPTGAIGDGGGIGTGGGALNCRGLTDGTKSSAGCDYYAVVPDMILGGNGACFAVFLANTWKEPIAIGVEYDGQTLNTPSFAFIPSGTGAGIKYTKLEGGMIPPGEVAILFLNRASGGLPTIGLNFDCPAGINAAIRQTDAAVHGTGMGKAFHITTTAAVAAYDIYPYGGGQSALTSATLLLPSTSWDTNYIAVDAHGASGPLSGHFVQIVGQEDATEVTISPTNDIVAAGGVAGAKKGQPTKYTVNRGQVLQFTQDVSLAGSAILSTKPIGVWGGKAGLAIDTCCNDSGHQQIPPVRALGNEYVGVRYRNRYDGIEETPPWRLIGAVDGTQLTWEQMPPGAPSTLSLGQVAEFRGSGPFVVKSQDDKHPFYMAAYMTGAAQWDPQQKNASAPSDGRGDAEFVNVVPPGEFPSEYVFFTDPTYPETNLVLVRTKAEGGFADVSLDCAGNLTGWQPIGTSGNYEYTRIDLVRHNFQPQGACNNGRHEIHSKNPFGLTVWGWGSGETGTANAGFYSQYVSYAYPGGANVKPINSVVVTPVIR